MSRLTEIVPKFVETITGEPEPGVLYISEEYGVAVHLCACGCGGKTVTPLGPGEWSLAKNGDKVTLRPSIGNWSGESPYHAHYFITDNRVDWC